MVFSSFIDTISMDIVSGNITRRDTYGKMHELQEFDKEIIVFNGKNLSIQFPLTNGITETINYINNKSYFFLNDITEIIENYYNSYITHMEYKALLDFIRNNKNVSFDNPSKIKKKFLFLNNENKNFNGFTHVNETIYKLELGKY